MFDYSPLRYKSFELYSVEIRDLDDTRKFSEIRMIDSETFSKGVPIFLKDDGDASLPLREPLPLCGPRRPPLTLDPIYFDIGDEDSGWSGSSHPLPPYFGHIQFFDVYDLESPSIVRVCGEWIDQPAVGGFNFSFDFDAEGKQRTISSVKGEIYVMCNINELSVPVRLLGRRSNDTASDEMTKRQLIRTGKIEPLEAGSSIPLLRPVLSFHRGEQIEIGCHLEYTVQGDAGQPDVPLTIDEVKQISAPSRDKIASYDPFHQQVVMGSEHPKLIMDIVWATHISDSEEGLDREFFPKIRVSSEGYHKRKKPEKASCSNGSEKDTSAN